MKQAINQKCPRYCHWQCQATIHLESCQIHYKTSKANLITVYHLISTHACPSNQRVDTKSRSSHKKTCHTLEYSACKVFLSEITPTTELLTGFLVCCHYVHLQVVHCLKCLITFETLELPDNGVGPLSVQLEGVLIFEGSAADDTLVRFCCTYLGEWGHEVPLHRRLWTPGF